MLHIIINEYGLNHDKACLNILVAGCVGHLLETDNTADIRLCRRIAG